MSIYSGKMIIYFWKNCHLLLENYNSPKQIAWKKIIQDTGLNFLKNNQLYDNNYKNLSEKYRRFVKLFGRNGYVSNKILNEYFVE